MNTNDQSAPARCLVRGIGDVGSAVAHRLHTDGFRVAIHDVPAPTVHRRRMAFADAAFDGEATLDGVTARRCDDVAAVVAALGGREIPVFTGNLDTLLAATTWDVLIDARLRKRSAPEDQRGRARRVIGLGPGFVIGTNCDIGVETNWQNLGAVLTAGRTAPLQGEPRRIGGHARERLVYAPVAGVLATAREIGEPVAAGEILGEIGGVPVTAPLAGVIRGLTRSGVAVAAGTKVVEIDPRGAAGQWSGLGERPRQIADGVRRALASTT